MTFVRFLAPVLALALTSTLRAQAPEPEMPEAPESTPLPGITRVLIRSEKLALGAKLWVKNRNGDINVMGWDKEEVHVIAEIRDTDRRRVELVIQPKEDDLDIETVFQQPFWSFNWGLVQSPRCEMTIFVPERLSGSFRTTSGSIFVSYLAGYLFCETTNGDIQVKHFAGEADARTKNGTIEGLDLQARLKAVTVNGDVTLTEVAGGIAAETTNGNMVAKGLNGWGEGISLTTINGSIEVALGVATGEITLEGAEGGLNLKVSDAKVLENAKGSARLQVAGSRQKINLRTTNGTITLRD